MMGVIKLVWELLLFHFLLQANYVDNVQNNVPHMGVGMFSDGWKMSSM
jgi:hypothetical protein